VSTLILLKLCRKNSGLFFPDTVYNALIIVFMQMYIMQSSGRACSGSWQPVVGQCSRLLTWRCFISTQYTTSLWQRVYIETYQPIRYHGDGPT